MCEQAGIYLLSKIGLTAKVKDAPFFFAHLLMGVCSAKPSSRVNNICLLACLIEKHVNEANYCPRASDT